MARTQSNDDDDDSKDDESAWDEAGVDEEEWIVADEDDELDSCDREAAGGDHGEDSSTIPCPCCSRLIHEDSQRSPYCENYVSQEDGPTPKKPRWIIIGIALSLVVVFLWLRFG